MYIYYPSNATVYTRQVGGPNMVTEQWINYGPDSVIIISGSFPPTASMYFITASYAVSYATSQSLCTSASFSDTASYSLNAGLSPTSSYAATASVLNPFQSTYGTLSASFNPTTSLSQGSLILWINALSSSYYDTSGFVSVTLQGQIARHFKDLSGLGRNLQQPFAVAANTAVKYGLLLNQGNDNNKPALMVEGSSGVAAVSSTFTTPTYPLWLFAVTRNLPPTYLATQAIFDGVTNATRMACWVGTTPQLYSGATLSAAITGSLTGSIANRWCLWSFKNTAGGTNSYIKTNGTQSVFGNAGAQSITGYTLGADYAGNGGGVMIAELLLFSNITDADALMIENWLKCRHELVY